MARTLDEIKQAIRADFVANITLQEAYGLDPAKTFDEQFSKVSLEAVFTFIVASAIYLFELIVDQKKAEVENMVAVEMPFSIPWYYAKSLAFQLGDLVTFDETTYKFAYPVIDETKRIVKYAAIRQREVSGVTRLQVFASKANKAALTANELNAFKAYIKGIGAAGTHFDFVSLAPDQLTINLTVYYNPQLIGGDGTSTSGGNKPVNDAIDSYLGAIKYGGAFNRTKLIDVVQAASGVYDAVLGDVRMNGDLVNTQSFESPSGFYVAATVTAIYIPSYES
jgi:hypothetical protein